MYKHMLIPTDGSALSEMAVRHGMALAKAAGARVTVLTVSLPFRTFALDPVMVSDSPVQYEQECEALAEKALGTARTEAGMAGVACETLHVAHAQPYQAIVETAQTKGCDLICMASHGRKGISAFVLGSETYKVLTHSKIPVLVCR
ncbi:MAG TPA: universal stress protein [Methylomirabilota bacterium]|nr:universal stress protein [Methylomirabilota bacterium]